MIGEGRNSAPEGAKAVTSQDVISKAEPTHYENIEAWLLVSPSGLRETVTVRLDISEKAELQVSPLDGSILGIKFEFKSGDAKNERTGRRFVPMQNLFFFDIAYLNVPMYAEGQSPVELELKRRADTKAKSIQEKAAKLTEGLRDEDLD